MAQRVESNPSRESEARNGDVGFVVVLGVLIPITPELQTVLSLFYDLWNDPNIR